MSQKIYVFRMCHIFFICLLVLFGKLVAQVNPAFDTTKSVSERIEYLISEMTLEEKASQLLYQSPAIPRLQIPAYNWWGECLHGVARFGRATVFPQPIGLAATFDDQLIFRIAEAIAREARVKYNAAVKMDNTEARYTGLTFWTPNINIFRDPRWGRGMETYGEDPYLTGCLGTAFVKGLQGDHPKYMKAAACAKHYVVHSGPEGLRHSFNAIPPKIDFYNTYLPAFKALVIEAKVEGVMCAYNRTYNEPCCGSNFLLKDILRNDWQFDGYLVSDCGAINDFHEGHNVTSNVTESVALSLKNGVNLNCGKAYENLVDAVKIGLISEKDIDDNLRQLLKTRFRLGLFDPPDAVPFNKIEESIVNSENHRVLAREAAIKSIVLLKNNNVLPLKKNIKKLFIIGPNASSVDVLLGNYHGLSEEMVTIVEGITKKVALGTVLEYRQGFLLDRDNINKIGYAVRGAIRSDATIAVIGLSTLLEGEEGESIASPYRSDRVSIGLPQNQIHYIKLLRENKKRPLVVVLTGGSPIAIPEIFELADAVLFVWYPGQQGGNAVADIIFGDAVPSGKLPVTFPYSTDQLPPYEDYSMRNRTYRYMTEDPLFPFGFGLSYTKFKYTDIKINLSKITADQELEVEAKVTNVGSVVSEEVVQLYIKDIEASIDVPLFSLKDFQRIQLKPGESKMVKFTVKPSMLSYYDENGESILEPGEFKVYLGGSLPVERSVQLGAAQYLEVSFWVE